MRATPTTPYTGPRPSPARPWAPWVIAVAAVIALGNAAQCGLNLLERHYQQRRTTTSPPSVGQVRAALDTLKVLGTITVIAVLVWFVLALVWGNQRRPKARLRSHGEGSVEPSLRNVSPGAWVALWIALGIAVVAALGARGVIHPGMTIDDFVRYRTYLAASNLARAALWTCWAMLAVRATGLQTQREATPFAPRDAKSHDALFGVHVSSRA